MSEIMLGVGASHSTLMNTNWDEVADLPGPQSFRRGLEAAAQEIARARPDAVIIIGSNHFRGLFLDLMPAVTIGVGECTGAGEAGTPSGRLPVDIDLARQLAHGLIDEGFDLAFSLRITVDHGITHSLQHLVPALDIPIVPIIFNMFAPPLIALRRCHNLGAAIGRIVAASGGNKRIAVIASGGLSHRLPWPKWFETLSDDDRFLVDAWLNGREDWPKYEVRRRQIIRAAEAAINPEFDRQFLAMLTDGDVSPVLGMSSDEIEATAGNGAQEIRSWLAMAGALGRFTGRTLAYEPINEWLTGMAVLTAAPIR
jgi:2,3-dihydroxyphenylpropionate 1,2-dioxygenase